MLSGSSAGERRSPAFPVYRTEGPGGPARPLPDADEEAYEGAQGEDVVEVVVPSEAHHEPDKHRKIDQECLPLQLYGSSAQLLRPICLQKCDTIHHKIENSTDNARGDKHINILGMESMAGNNSLVE